MKALLFILVIGNLLLLGLAFAPDPDAPGPVYVPPTPPGVQRLQLLSERSEQASDEAQQVKQENARAVESTSDEKPAMDEQLEAAPAIDTVAENEAPVTEVPPLPPGPVCHTVGPFAEKKDADNLSKALRARNAVTAMRQSEIQEPAGYWVYLPSMKREKAKAIVDSLKENNIKDYFVGAQNYISLGIYSSHETAQERFEQITELGYNPKLDQRYKVRDVYWLDIEELEPPFIAEQDWPEILAENPGVRHQNLACE